MTPEEIEARREEMRRRGYRIHAHPEPAEFTPIRGRHPALAFLLRLLAHLRGERL